jgi:hypothetical protein
VVLFRKLAISVVINTFLTISVGASPGTPHVRLPDFSCASFPPDLSEHDLVVRFGAGNVVTAQIEGGGAEGEYNEGTVLFPKDSEARLEIFWKTKEPKRTPDWVRVDGPHSHWRYAGITLGTDLLTVEKLNGGPFVLTGFATDSEGALISWGNGRLRAFDSEACRVQIWLSQGKDANDRLGNTKLNQLEHQVVGIRAYSSGHPAMQALNPRVYEMMVRYGP